MASGLLGARGPLLLLVSFVVFGSGLHIELLGGKNNQLFATESRIRQKREWIVPPAIIWEEQDNSRKNPIAKIHSDRAEEKGVIVTYTISGPGVTEPPYNLFVINGKTGELNVTRIVDREQTPMFHLKGYALDQNGKNLERPLDLRIKVLDINDNSPVFSQEVFTGSIEELCEVGTIVMKINATDADDPETSNAKIAFKIISQDPSFPPAFKINRATGEVWTNIANLDREEQSIYSLVVEARDLDGKANGQSHQASLQIRVLDVNDNIPILEKTMYEGSVKENIANVEIMRLKVFDRDEEFTDNWLANFTIVSGNEGGHFKIETDSQTNEGILTVVKELNYEELKNIDLNIVVSNKAAYHKSITTKGYQAKPIPVKIKVENVVEGPVFKPQTLVIKTSETMKVNQIIGSFQAYDEDTGKIAQHIRYAKDRDVENWFTIDSKTAEIKLIKVPDYESSFVVNGTYYATILAISNDSPAKTATGTIAIQVEDFNDHCPVLTNPDTTVCSDAKFINLTAEDRDAYPNGGPFTFTVTDERMSDRWIVSRLDGGFRAQLIPQNLKPGRYEIPLLVRDNQGLSCPDQQILKLHVCECVEGGGCRAKIIGSSVILGPAAIALIILALLLLLLIPLLLLACGFGSRGSKGFVTIPEHSEEMLRNWNSEGAAPEDQAIPNLITSSSLGVGAGAAGVAAGAGAGAAAGIVGSGGSSSLIKEHYIKSVDGRWEEQSPLLSGSNHAGMELGATTTMEGGRSMTVGSRRLVTMETGGVMNDEFLRNYFSEKADAFAEDDEAQLAKDCLLIYSQEEEKDSLHGSVGCCSFIEGDFDDHFLDDLGDKFKTLAEICMGKYTGMETGTHSSQVPNVGGLSQSMGGSNAQYLHQQNANHIFASNSSYQQPEPVTSFGSETTVKERVTETTMTSGLQQVKPIADPVVSSSNVVVTETTYGAMPPTITLDPNFKENVVVTERILAPATNLQDRLEMPTGVFPDLPDSKYVVVRERERVLIPSSELKPSLSNPNLVEEQNRVVTERVVTPTPGIWSTAELGGNDRQERVLISDPFFSQGSAKESLPAGSTLSKSSTVKYSSVQYTR